MFAKQEHEGVLENSDCERSELTRNHWWKASDDKLPQHWDLMPARKDEDPLAVNKKDGNQIGI